MDALAAARRSLEYSQTLLDAITQWRQKQAKHEVWPDSQDPPDPSNSGEFP